jgi:hypothetical protein
VTPFLYFDGSKMRITKSFKALVPDLAATLGRFPGPIVASLVLCVAANLTVAERSFAGDQFYNNMLWSGTAAFIASGSAHLFAESRNWAREKNIAFSFLIGLAAATLFWFHGVLGVHRMFFMVGLVLLLMTAAYLRPRASQAAFWVFNLRLGLAALLAIGVTAAACGGISAVLASLEFLFEIKIPQDLERHVWATGASLVGPIYGLALTPGQLDEEIDLESYRDYLLERGLSVLLTYVLIPLVLIYSAILYAYAGKIALAWALPKGQIATLVTLYALAGTAAYLISYPWRSRGPALLRIFRSAWFPLTVVPLVLLIVGTWRRIHDYGITPERYALIVIAAWLGALIIAFLYQRRSIDIRQIVGSLAIMTLVTSIGPWGAHTLSIHDQFGRLESLLSKHGFLTNGKLTETPPPPTNMPGTERDMAGSIIYFLANNGGHERLRPWFEGRAASPWNRKDFRPNFVSEPLIRMVGYRYRETPGNIQRVNFTSHMPSTFAATHGKVIAGPVKLIKEYRPQLEQTARVPRIENRGTALAVLHENRTWLIKTSDLLARAVDADALPYPQPSFSVTVGEPQAQMTLIVQQIFGQFDRGEAKVDSGQFWIILPK